MPAALPPGRQRAEAGVQWGHRLRQRFPLSLLSSQGSTVAHRLGCKGGSKVSRGGLPWWCPALPGPTSPRTPAPGCGRVLGKAGEGQSFLLRQHVQRLMTVVLCLLFFAYSCLRVILKRKKLLIITSRCFLSLSFLGYMHVCASCIN